jgi:atypical dual specificity phosphatase
MSAPDGFTWVDPPLLAASARPASRDDYEWLRAHGVQLMISLGEDPPPRVWLNDVGLLSMHIPVEDMHPPSSKQIEVCLSAIEKAHSRQFGVCIHCTAGLGRTGTMLACYFVKKGMTAETAIEHIRQIRPGSVETPEQADSVREYARLQKIS